MKQEFHSIAMLRKKFESIKFSKSEGKHNEFEAKAASLVSLLGESSKSCRKYENLSADKLIRIIKGLKRENKELKKINERQAGEIKELTAIANGIKESNKGENSPRPQSCLRTSNSVPKKNRVMFSRDLVQVLNDKTAKASKTMKSRGKDDPASCYSGTIKKISKKNKAESSQSPPKVVEDNDYYTPLSSSLQEKKILSTSLLKRYDHSPKAKDKNKGNIKIAKF